MGIIDQLKQEEQGAPPVMAAGPAPEAPPAQVPMEAPPGVEDQVAAEGGDDQDARIQEIMEQIHQKSMEDPNFKKNLAESNLPQEIVEALAKLDVDAGEVVSAIISDASKERKVLKSIMSGEGSLETELQNIATEIMSSGDLNRGGETREPMPEMDSESGATSEDPMDQKLMALLGKA